MSSNVRKRPVGDKNARVGGALRVRERHAVNAIQS